MHKHHGEGGDEEPFPYPYPFPSPPRNLSVQQMPGMSVTIFAGTTSATSTATCPLGYVVGGGYTTGGTPSPSVISSMASGNAWMVTITGFPGQTVQAFAECALLS